MIALTVLSETKTTLTLGWTPVVGAAGYEFLVDGTRVSNTWDATRSSVKFGKPDTGEHTYSVVVLGKTDEGDLVWPAVTPPPVTTFVQLPVGPFTAKSAQQTYTSPSGSVISKLDIENIPGNVDGLMVMAWPPKLSTSRYTISDIIAQNIGNVPPTSNGEHEAGIWIGQSVDAERLVCDGSWEGLWTGSQCADSVIRNFTVGKKDTSGGYSLPAGGVAGLYLEHFTRRTLFQNFEIHSIGSKGIISEWWYPDSTEWPFVQAEYPTAASGKAGSCHNTFDTGRIYCPAGGYGIYLDAGTWGCTVKNITFWGPGNAYREVGPLAGPDPNVYGQASCTYLNGGSKVEFEHADPARVAPVK